MLFNPFDFYALVVVVVEVGRCWDSDLTTWWESLYKGTNARIRSSICEGKSPFAQPLSILRDKGGG